MSTSQSTILVINNGSSSPKFSVLDPKSETVLSSGLAERIGTEQGYVSRTENIIGYFEPLAGGFWGRPRLG